MASYGEYTPQDSSYSGMFWGETDVSRYVSWSTFIEFCHGHIQGNYGSEYGNRADYVTYLQYWDGSRWTNVESHVGYFSYSVCIKWSLAGKKAGSYRVRTVYQYKGANYVNRTNAFTVQR